MSADEFNHKFKVGSFPWEEKIPGGDDAFNHISRLENYVRNTGYVGDFLVMFMQNPGIGYTLEFRDKPTKRQLKKLDALELTPTDY